MATQKIKKNRELFVIADYAFFSREVVPFENISKLRHSAIRIPLSGCSKPLICEKILTGYSQLGKGSFCLFFQCFPQCSPHKYLAKLI
jgi:hypothetical protein